MSELLPAAKAVMERRQLDVKEKAEIQSLNDQMRASLPGHYGWLRDWQHV